MVLLFLIIFNFYMSIARMASQLLPRNCPIGAHALPASNSALGGLHAPIARPPPPRCLAAHRIRSLPEWWEEEGGGAAAAGGDKAREERPWLDRSRRRKAPAPRPATPAELPLARVGPGETAAFFSPQSWAEVGADPALVEGLAALGVTRPSHIQAAAFKALGTAARHVVLADHAGSGKTLAYLAPLVQAVKAEERALGGPATVPRCPRFVVVVPTAELCAQVLRVARALSAASPALRFSSAAMTGGHPPRTQRQALDNGVDVVVGTPGRLAELLAEGSLSLERAAGVVCDEVDVLLGGASLFAEQVAPLRAAAPPSARFVLVTATLPADVYSQLEPAFPGLVAALGPGLHRSAPGVTEQIVDCSGGDEVSEESGAQRKSAALFAALQERRAPRTIVFCNKIDTCRGVENFLNRTLGKQDAALTALPYHAAVAEDQRAANLRRFLMPPRPPPPAPRDGAPAPPQERLVLVCTDRASRGVDSAYVDHVVLFDFPRDPSEYVRRVGRTARGAGGRGLVTVLVLGRQVKLAQDVVGKNQRGLPVHPLPNAMPAASAAGGTDRARFAADVRRGGAAAAAVE
jgi:ATP-dependent RNA helicase DDX18/HAS1